MNDWDTTIHLRHSSYPSYFLQPLLSLSRFRIPSFFFTNPFITITQVLVRSRSHNLRQQNTAVMPPSSNDYPSPTDSGYSLYSDILGLDPPDRFICPTCRIDFRRDFGPGNISLEEHLQPYGLCPDRDKASNSIQSTLLKSQDASNVLDAPNPTVGPSPHNSSFVLRVQYDGPPTCQLHDTREECEAAAEEHHENLRYSKPAAIATESLKRPASEDPSESPGRQGGASSGERKRIANAERLAHWQD